MPDLSTYRLQSSQSPPKDHDFIDPATGQVVGVDHYQAGITSLPFWAIFGSRLRRLRERRPRWIVRRPGDDEGVFTLGVSSGLMYESRRVYDGQGALIAHFESHFKTSLRMGFGIIDLRGIDEDSPTFSLP